MQSRSELEDKSHPRMPIKKLDGGNRSFFESEDANNLEKMDVVNNCIVFIAIHFQSTLLYTVLVNIM